jgi:hypothetical protein
MRKVITLLTLLAFIVIPSWGYAFQQREQQPQAAPSDKAATKPKTDAESSAAGNVTLKAGTEIDAKMSSALDLKKAKPGDSFQMKTGRSIKQQGKEVLSKGSVITGHVDQVNQAGATTQLKLVFDRVEDKKTRTTAPLQAVVNRVEGAQPAMGPETMTTPRSWPSTPDSSIGNFPQQRGEASSEGLPGRVPGSAGGNMGPLGPHMDPTVGTGSSPGDVREPARPPIQVVSQSVASGGAGSTLAVSGPKIDSGIRFVLKTTSDLALAPTAPIGK